jgi:Ca2+-binding RTX toxin-like protein
MVFGLVGAPGAYQFFPEINGMGAISIVEGNDALSGGAGNDTLYGGGGDDYLDGGSNEDVLYGNAGNDNMYGGAGNDLLDGGTGADTMFGGAGNDVYLFDHNWEGSATDHAIENANEGTDEVRTSVDLGIDWMPNIENLTALGTGNLFLGGSDGDNVVTGNSGDNYIVGGGGNDTLIGDAGNDIASYQLPVGTPGTIELADGTDADAGKLLVNIVDGGVAQTYLKISRNGPAFTVEGVGVGAFMGTDTLTGIEQIHTFVQTGDGSPAAQFLAVNLAAQQYGDFVSGGEFDEVLNVGDFAGAVNANGNRGNDTITAPKWPTTCRAARAVTCSTALPETTTSRAGTATTSSMAAPTTIT